MSLKGKTVVVIDNGLFVGFAETLAKTAGKLYYHCSSGNAYRKMTKGMIGTGVPGLIVLEDSPYQLNPDKVDLWVYPDVNFGYEQEEMRDRGFRVFGSGLGELMENDRVQMKEWMVEQKLQVGPYDVVVGMEALRDYLKTHKDVYVKISKWRGSFETFHSMDYRIVEPKLDLIQQELGPLGKSTQFVIEQSLPDRAELGVDMWTSDGALPQSFLAGIEIKDSSYCGKFLLASELPKPLAKVNEALAPIFKRFGYRGAFSTEVRTNGPGDAYMVDFTGRAGSPPNEIYQDLYTNFGDIVWACAGGEIVEPVPLAKFGAQLVIHSTFTNDNWNPVFHPPEIRQFVKLINTIEVDGIRYVAPQHEGLDSVGSVTGFGDTAEEACEQAIEHAKQIEGPGIDFAMDALDKAIATGKDAEKMGLKIL